MSTTQACKELMLVRVTRSYACQDDAGTLMNSNLPDFNDSDALAAHAHNRSAGTSSNGEGLGITNGVMSFKLLSKKNTCQWPMTSCNALQN